MLTVEFFLETLGVSAILPFVDAILEPEELVNKWYGLILVNVLEITDENTILICLGCGIILAHMKISIFQR